MRASDSRESSTCVYPFTPLRNEAIEKHKSNLVGAKLTSCPSKPKATSQTPQLSILHHDRSPFVSSVCYRPKAQHINR